MLCGCVALRDLTQSSLSDKRLCIQMVYHRTVQFIGAAFWCCGGMGTSILCAKNLFKLGPLHSPSSDPHHFFIGLAIAVGFLLALLFYLPVVFIPLARREVQRIKQLENPSFHHFFEKKRLVALLLFIPSMVILNKKTEQYFVSNIIFGGLVIPVTLGLWVGGLFIMLKTAIYYNAVQQSAPPLLQKDDDNKLYSIYESEPSQEHLEKSIVQADLGFRGSVVGVYSVVKNGTLYDLNDHYSMPRVIYGYLIRSPVECAINAMAFLVLLGMTVFAYQAEDVPELQHVGRVDWLVTAFKLSHLFFHAWIHVLPNFSAEKGMKYLKCPRVICGIVFGLSRYAVFLILAYRYSLDVCIALAVVFVVFSPLRLLGEVIKTVAGVACIGFIMCSRSNCSGNCYLCLVGGVLQIFATGSFYLVGQCRGHRYREWRRKEQRAWVPFHVVSDFGNALWIIGANYWVLGNGAPVAFDVGVVNASFPMCWWR